MYNYWTVGYIPNAEFIEKNPNDRIGRIEIYDSTVDSPYSMSEIGMRYDTTEIDSIKFEDWIDSLETELVLNFNQLVDKFKKENE